MANIDIKNAGTDRADLVSALTALIPPPNLYAVGNTTASTTSGPANASSLSFSGAGAVSVGISGSSVVISAPAVGASATSMGLTALGNTTGATSSMTQALTADSISGAGGVSVGFNAGTMVISGATAAAQSVQTLGVYAVGNTTTSVSSMTADARSLSFDGAGLVSVGMSGGSVIISATSGATSQSVQTLGMFAVGNTTTSISSMTADARSLSFDGAGAVSVGMSGGSVVISSPATVASATSMGMTAVGNTTGTTSSMTQGVTAETLSGGGAVSVGFNAGTIVISSPVAVASGTVQSRSAIGNTTGASVSAVATLSLLTVSGAGGVSVGYDTLSSGVLVISGVTASGTTAASGTAQNRFALGNTTGASSSEVATLSILSLSGAGGVSIGYDTASSGVVVVSGATTAAQTAAGLNIYAVGNTTTSVSSGAIAAGSLSFDGAGAVSVGVSGSSIVISSPATVASGTIQNRSALGNTTGASVSAVGTLSVLSVSGAGGVSVGYDTVNSGVLVVSGPAAGVASATSMNITAVGNTTGSSSATTRNITAETFSGAGIVSVGFSGNSVLISATAPAASATSMAQSAIGNTTGTTASMTQLITNDTVSGAGGVSVGFSGATFIISGPTVNSGSVAQGAVTMSYFDGPIPGLNNAVQLAVGNGAEWFMPLWLQQNLTWDYASIAVNYPVAFGTISVSTAAVSSTHTASAAWNGSFSLGIYTSVNSSSYNSSTNIGTMSYGMSQSWSVSRTGASNTVSMTQTLSWNSGTATGVTTTFSTTGSTITTSAYALSAAVASSWGGLMRFDLPWASSLSPGFYVVGILHNSTSSTVHADTGVTVAAGNWSGNEIFHSGGGTAMRSGPGAAGSNFFYKGYGNSTSAGSVFVATFNIESVAGGISCPRIGFANV